MTDEPTEAEPEPEPEPEEEPTLDTEGMGDEEETKEEAE